MADVLTHSQVVPSLGEFGEFESITGGDPVGNFVPYFPAGSKIPRLISSTGQYTDIVMTRAYISGRDNQLIEWWKRQLSGADPVPRTAVKQFRNALGIVEDTLQWQVNIKEVKTPDGKAGDNNIAEISVTLAVQALL